MTCTNCGQPLVGAFADGYGHFDPKAQRYVCKPCQSAWHRTRTVKRAASCPICGEDNEGRGGVVDPRKLQIATENGLVDPHYSDSPDEQIRPPYSDESRSGQ